MQKRQLSAADLIDTGLLWAVNRQLLHPQGYALAVADDGTFQLWGDGREPWRFGDDVDEAAKLEAFRHLLATVTPY